MVLHVARPCRRSVSTSPPARTSPRREGRAVRAGHFGDISTEDDLEANLAANCIPSGIFDMGVRDYERFLEGRRVLMARKIRSYFEGL